MQSKEEQHEGNRGRGTSESSHFRVENAQTRSATSHSNCAAREPSLKGATKRGTKASKNRQRGSSPVSSSHNSVDDLLRRIAKQANDERRRADDRDVSDSRYAAPTTATGSRQRRRRSSQERRSCSSREEERVEHSQSRRRHNSSSSSRWDIGNSSSGVGGGARSSQEQPSRSRFAGTDEGGQAKWNHPRARQVKEAAAVASGAAATPAATTVGAVGAAGAAGAAGATGAAGAARAAGATAVRVHGSSGLVSNGQRHGEGRRVDVASSATAVSAANTDPFTEGMWEDVSCRQVLQAMFFGPNSAVPAGSTEEYKELEGKSVTSFLHEIRSNKYSVLATCSCEIVFLCERSTPSATDVTLRKELKRN